MAELCFGMSNIWNCRAGCTGDILRAQSGTQDDVNSGLTLCAPCLRDEKGFSRWVCHTLAWDIFSLAHPPFITRHCFLQSANGSQFGPLGFTKTFTLASGSRLSASTPEDCFSTFPQPQPARHKESLFTLYLPLTLCALCG